MMENLHPEANLVPSLCGCAAESEYSKDEDTVMSTECVSEVL